MGIKAFDKANPSTKQLEVYNKFDGGINTELADSILGDNEFREIINFDMDAAGSLKKRPGLYRLPGGEVNGEWKTIHDIVYHRLWLEAEAGRIYKGIDSETNQPIPEDLVDLRIHDVYNFFDGANWVFNYVTNKGVLVLRLNSQMQISKEWTEANWQEYCQFIRLGNGDTTKFEDYQVTFSTYNDTWIMKIAASGALATWKNAQRQVSMYNWNPINDVIQIENESGQLEDYTLKPGWREAVENAEDAITTTQFGKPIRGSLEGSSTHLAGAIVGPWEDSTFEIPVGFEPYASKNVDVRVYLRRGSYNRSYLEIWQRPNKPNRPAWDSTKHRVHHFLRHPDNTHVLDSEIKYVVYRGNGEFWVYLNNAIKVDESSASDFYDFSKDTIANAYIWWFKVVIDGVNPPRTEYITLCTQTLNPNIEALSNLWAGPSYANDTKYNIITSREYYEAPIGKNQARNKANTLVLNELGVPFKTKFSSSCKANMRNWQADDPDNAGYRKVNLYKTNNYLEENWDNLTKIKDVTDFSFDVKKHETNIIIEEIWHTEYNVVTYGAIETPTYDNVFTVPSKDHYKNMVNGLVFALKFSKDSDGNYIPDRTTYTNLGGSFSSAYLRFYKHGANALREGYLLAVPNKTTQAENPFKVNSDALTSNIVKDNFFGMAPSLVQATYTVQGSAPTSTLLACARYEYDQFVFETPTPESLFNLYSSNIGVSKLESVIPVYGRTLMDMPDVEELEKLLAANNVISTDVYVTWKYKIPKKIGTTLKTYQIFQFLDALKDSQPRFRARGLGISTIDDIHGEEHSYPTYEEAYTYFEWQPEPGGDWVILFKIDRNNCRELLHPNNLLDYLALLNSFKLVINYSYIKEDGATKVLNYEELVYAKPTLADLTNIWYNLILFDTAYQSQWPNIYSSSYWAISKDLVEYPVGDVTSGIIQLFGLVPVNDVILQPGKQRFQLFYNAVKTDPPESGINQIKNLIVAVTAMSIDNYTAMINSADYSTTGYKGEGKDKVPVKGPNWQSWETVFTGFDQDPNYIWPTTDSEPGQAINPNPNNIGKLATFELDIPSTTQPYIVMVQVAERAVTEDIKDDEGNVVTPGDPQDYPDLATVQEVKIQMQPTTSYRTKINIANLFDEFVSTTQLTNYSTSLVGYGDSNKLFFSDSAVPTYFPLSAIMQMKTPEAIQHCTIFQNKLIVSSTNSKFYVGGSSFESESDPYYIREISSDTGLLAPKSEVPLGNFLYFLDSSGIKILKNLYGTADKEFSFENIDIKISQLVPRTLAAKNAIGVAYRNKYYLHFPEFRYMLVYNVNYKAWVAYEGDNLRFSSLFVYNDELYAVGLDNFNIFKFDDNVFVDNWNEYENGYKVVTSLDGSHLKVQDGDLIKCELKTKNYDQSYIPHRKKYDWALISAITKGQEFATQEEIDAGIELEDKVRVQVNAICPRVYIDDNLINYEYETTSMIDDQRSVWHYKPATDDEGLEDWFPNPIYVREGSYLNSLAIVANDETTYGSRLGENANSYYNIPIQRKGNTISFGLLHKDYTGITLDSIVVRFGLAKIRKNRGRQS